MSKIGASKLSRTRDQRRALIKGLANALVLEEKLTTTRPKAKTLVPYFEKLVSWAKAGTLQARREVQKGLTSEAAVRKMMTELGPRFAKRSGGYIRLEAVGWRQGDNAELLKVTIIASQTASTPAKSPAVAKTKVKAKPVKITTGKKD